MLYTFYQVLWSVMNATNTFHCDVLYQGTLKGPTEMHNGHCVLVCNKFVTNFTNLSPALQLLFVCVYIFCIL